MSDQLFEVVFSGQISDGEKPEDVKTRVAKIFKADDAKLTQLFSGKRIVIKKNIDQATAAKYKSALNQAGAECEVNSWGGAKPAAQTATIAPSVVAARPEGASASISAEYETSYTGEVEPPPHTDPLGITGDQIEDLEASLAPVGSELQNSYMTTDAPPIDITGLDVAPVGSDLGPAKKDLEPAPPDIPAITLVD